MASFVEAAGSAASLLRVKGQGWDPSLIVNADKIAELTCKGCDNICKDAVELSCDHNDDELNLYCNGCLIEVLKKNNQNCPINPSHKQTAVCSSRYARKQILKLKVFCPYSIHYKNQHKKNKNDNSLHDTMDEKEGSNININVKTECDWIGTLNDLIKNHISNCKSSASSNDRMKKTVNVIKEKLDKIQLNINTYDETFNNMKQEIIDLKFLNETMNSQLLSLKQVVKKNESKIIKLEQNHQSEMIQIGKTIDDLMKNQDEIRDDVNKLDTVLVEIKKVKQDNKRLQLFYQPEKTKNKKTRKFDAEIKEKNAQIAALLAELKPHRDEKARIEFFNRTYNCPICMEEFRVSGDCFLMDCGHMLNRNCALQAFKADIQNVRVLPRCPTCLAMDKSITDVTELQLELLADDQLMDHYYNLTLSLGVQGIAEQQNAGIIFKCPTADCIFLADIPGDLERFNCNKCGNAYCTKCKRAYHHKETCEQYKDRKCKEEKLSEQQLEKLAKKNGWKKCPKCRHWIERTYGCFHMTCGNPQCKAEYCDSCGKTLDKKKWKLHFNHNKCPLWGRMEDLIDNDVDFYPFIV